MRAARERPGVFILALTSNLNTALRHLLLWGGHCIHSRDVSSISEMVESVVTVIQHCALGKTAERVVIFAGIPFPTPGATNALHIVRLGWQGHWSSWRDDPLKAKGEVPKNKRSLRASARRDAWRYLP